MGKRMSLKQWFALWLVFVVYWFLGATLFYSIEHPLEHHRREVERAERNELHDLLVRHYQFGPHQVFNEIMDKLTNYCEKPFSKADNSTEDKEEEEHPYHWSFYNSVFFSLITASTVGYGNVSPSSDRGKILVIFYSIIGIPFLGIVMSQLGDFFSSIFVKAHDKYKAQVYETRTALVLGILKYLVPGVIVFIVAPACVIAHMEDWSMVTAIYYSYVTLTTIGYGDFVAGHLGDRSVGYAVYKAVLLFWIMFGLGYLIMILGFISRAMRSKRVIRLERKLATRLKQTQSKIWNEFIHDVSHVRRLLNEMYLLRVKPVYRERPLLRSETQCQSCPDLTEWPVLRKRSELEKEEEVGRLMGLGDRRRAYSENEPSRLMRVMSEGQLDKIDRVATFSGTAGLEASSLMARVADALVVEDHPTGSLQGIDIFSDEEILESEKDHYGKENGWAQHEHFRPRGRALSDAAARGPPPSHALHQWAILNNMNLNNIEAGLKAEAEKPRSLTPPPSGLRRMSIAAMNFFTSSTRKKSLKTDDEETKERRKHRLSLQELDKEDSSVEELNYRTYTGSSTSGRRPSLLAALTPRSGSTASISPILEQTTLADFIRAVSTLREAEERKRSRPPSQSPVEILQRRRFSHIPNLSSNNSSEEHLTTGVRRRAVSVAPPPSSFHRGSPVRRSDDQPGWRRRLPPTRRSTRTIPTFLITSHEDPPTLLESEERPDHIVVRL